MATDTKATPAKQAATAPAKQAAPAKQRRTLTDVERAAKEREKQAKFQEIARPRLARCLKIMKQLETIGRGANYSYTTEQANKLLQHLVDGVAGVKVAFAPRVRGSTAAQELPEL